MAELDRYVLAFQSKNPFNADQLRLHRATIQLRSELGSAKSALASTDFLKRLYLTLESWGMNSRGAGLVSFETFVCRWAMCAEDVVAFDGTRLDDLGPGADRVRKRLWRLIESLGITETKSQLVLSLQPSLI